MDRMSFRSSAVIFGRPALRRESNRQYHRKPARCQLTTASGFTISRTLDHFDHQRRESQPEEAIPPAQLGSRVLAFENGDLMTQRDKLKSEVIPRAEENAEPSKEGREKPGHRNSLHD
jgi:hypothetical protein